MSTDVAPRRRRDWVTQLWRVIGTYQRARFELGAHDCTLFYARCLDAMTDSSFESELRSLYCDRRSAARLLFTEGGLEAAITRRIGPPVAGCLARRGDGCLISRHVVGVCTGPFVVALTLDGLTSLPLDRTVKHWRLR